MIYRTLLWFAFILLPLPYWKQRETQRPQRGRVVICFHFTTFAVLETTPLQHQTTTTPLWFAFILLPLPYWKQLTVRWRPPGNGCDLLSFYYLCRTGNNERFHKWLNGTVVICFHFTTFAVLETTRTALMSKNAELWFAFILLPLPYWKQPTEICCIPTLVVICFHFTTFAVLETTERTSLT